MHQKGTLHLDAMHQKGILHPDAMHQKGALHLDAMHQNGTLHLDAITIAPVITMLVLVTHFDTQEKWQVTQMIFYEVCLAGATLPGRNPRVLSHTSGVRESQLHQMSSVMSNRADSPIATIMLLSCCAFY